MHIRQPNRLRQLGVASCSTVLAVLYTCLSALPTTAAAVPPAADHPSQTHTAVVLGNQMSNGMPMTAYPVGAWPTIVSQAAVVMDLNTGTVIYAKHPQTPHYPASLTKILTAMIALQRGQMTDKLTASQTAVNQPPDKLYLVPGEVEPLKKLLYAMMIDSANDVAVEIAQNYAGSVANFSNWMNQEAVSLGAVHSHFVNPSGLPNPQHVTTAYDMALITRAAMQIPQFRQIVATRSYHWQGEKWSADLVNLNGMLFTYPGTIGVKTGYTSVAHETLAVAATHGHTTFLAILLDAPLDAQIRADATSLLNFAFAHYQTQTILHAGTVVKQLHNPVDGRSVSVVTTAPVLETARSGQTLPVREQTSLRPLLTTQPQRTVVGQLAVTGDGQTVDVPLALGQPWAVAAPAIPTPGAWLHVRATVWTLLSGVFLLLLGRGFKRKWVRRRRRRNWR